MRKLVLLFVGVLASLSTQAQVSNDVQLQSYLEKNSKLYAVFSQHEHSKPLADEMFSALSYRLGQYNPLQAQDDVVTSKAMLFCAEAGAGMILVKGKLYACEVFDIKEQKLGKNNFLWAYSFDFQLTEERSKVKDLFVNILDQGMDLLKLNELFSLSGTVGLTIGYTWGEDYKNHKSLTLKKGFAGSQLEVANGWGAGLKILLPNQTKDHMSMVLGSILYGNSVEISEVVVKFRNGLQLKDKLGL